MQFDYCIASPFSLVICIFSHVAILFSKMLNERTAVKIPSFFSQISIFIIFVVV